MTIEVWKIRALESKWNNDNMYMYMYMYIVGTCSKFYI